MYRVVFATDDYEKCNDRWLCFYREWREIFEASIQKMSGIDPENLFRAPGAKNALFEKAFENVIRIKEEARERVERIIERSVEMCPAKDDFTVYFLPVPFGDYVIITNHSPNIGTFILYGVGENCSDEDLEIFIPHEYAHVVRLQDVLLSKGIDSPRQMKFGEIAIFEGLGVVFSMVFNGETDASKIHKYAGLQSPQSEYDWDKLMREFWRLKDRKFNEFSDEELQRYYYYSKEIYIMGAYLILRLVKEGHSICALDRMSAEEIMGIAKRGKAYF